MKKLLLLAVAAVITVASGTFLLNNTTDAAMPPGLTASLTVSLDKTQVVRANNNGFVTATASPSANFVTTNPAPTESSGNFGNVTTTVQVTCNGVAYPANQVRTWTKVETAYGPGTFNITSTSGTVNSGAVTVAVGADGTYSISMSATASQSATTTTKTYKEYRYKTTGQNAVEIYDGCSAWTSTSNQTYETSTNSITTATSSTVSASKSYEVDLVGPTATGAMGGSGTYTAGGSISGTFDIDNASVGQTAKVTLKIIQNGNVAASGSEEKTMLRSSMNIGPLGLDIPCSVAMGASTLAGTFESKDIAGNSWDNIDVTLGTFDVKPGVNLAASTGVVAQDAAGDYVYVPGYSVTMKKVKGTTSYTANPAAAHHMGLIEIPGRCNDTTNVSFTTTGPHMVITPAGGWKYIQTGASPYAHIFAGELPNGSVLDYHDPNLSLGEVTAIVKQTIDANGVIRIDLSGLGANIPATWKIYVRAKMAYQGGDPKSFTSGALFRFEDMVDNVNFSSPAFPMSNNATACLPFINASGVVLACQ